MLQYPLRPADRPYDIEKVEFVRYKPKSGKLEIELPKTGEAANPRNVDLEAAPNLRVDTRVLTSTETPVHEGYCVAAMRDGALHLTPVDAAFQMRPSLAHLDAADDRRKQEDAAHCAAGEKLRGDKLGTSRVADDPRGEGLSGLDAEKELKKESHAENVSNGPPTVATTAGLGDLSSGAHALVPLQVQVKRRETERQTEMRLHSHAYLKQLEEDERWSRLIPVSATHPYAVAARERIATVARAAMDSGAPRGFASGAGASRKPGKGEGGRASPVEDVDDDTYVDSVRPSGVPITAAAYLDALCPIASDRFPSGLAGDRPDANARGGSSGGDASGSGNVSKAQLESLPLAQRVHALFARGQKSVVRFARVMHFAPAGSDPEEVIAALRGVAHLVQGCWVACSALRCGGDARRERVRDHALLHFSRSREIGSSAFGRGPPPPSPPGELSLERLRRDVLAELAVPRTVGARGGAKGAGAGAGDAASSDVWTFIEQTDHEFIARYPELTKTELDGWKALAPWLESGTFADGSLNSGASPPQPGSVSNSAALAARALILPSMVTDGVVKLSFIRLQFERSGDPDVAKLALLREPEILGALGPNVVSVDGACCLKSIGDAAIDPFREFLINFLRKRGRSVRRTDVMEGAAAALGAAPTNAVYARCLSDLCVSRGSTWVMKTG